MSEEHGCEAPEGHILCANNCGFFGSTATLNLCSKCYRDFRLKEQQASAAKSAVQNSLSSSSSSSSPLFKLPDITSHVPFPSPATPPSSSLSSSSLSSSSSQSPAGPVQPNRCLVCEKRVGLTGFKCKCGTVFCGVHRYPEKHSCTFDFKSEGREAIARANPLVTAKKLEKI